MYDILIIGSGISALSFLDGLKIKNKNVGIISYKKKNKKVFDNINKLKLKEEDLPPRFNINSNIQSYIEYLKKNKIHFKKEISFFGYLNSGGVSNFWGCSCEFLTKKKINFLNSRKRDDLVNIFNLIYKKNNFTGNYNSELENTNFKKKKIDSFYFNIIEKTNTLKNKIQFYLNCIAVNKTNKLSFIPNNLNKDKLNKLKNLNYFVEKIEKKNSCYKVLCKDHHEKTIVIKTKKLVLAAGTIASTKLVMQMSNYKNKINILHNPMIFGAFLAKKNLHITKNLEPSPLAAKIKTPKSNFSSIANFRSSNIIIKKKIFKKFFFMKNFISKKIFSLFEKKILFINLYLDNKFSNLQIKIEKNGMTKISTKKSNLHTIKNELKVNLNTLYKNLRDNNLIYPLKYSYVPNLGTDNHFIGTLPISQKNKKLTLNENCELRGYKNLYIVDGSSIPKSEIKFPTGLIIANAYRIGKLL